MVKFFGCSVYSQLGGVSNKVSQKVLPIPKDKAIEEGSTPSNKKTKTYSLRHGSTLMDYFSNALATTYRKTIWYKHSVRV
jgi:hypothetical protein